MSRKARRQPTPRAIRDLPLQNIPIRTPLGAELQAAFAAKPDHVFIPVNYSQLEMRLVAAPFK